MQESAISYHKLKKMPLLRIFFTKGAFLSKSFGLIYIFFLAPSYFMFEVDIERCLVEDINQRKILMVGHMVERMTELDIA